MKEYIKKRLNTILEAYIEPHFIDRFNQRIMNPEIVSVGYEYAPAQYKIVGTYRISDEIKIKVKDVYNKVSRTKFDNKSYGVMVAYINIDKLKINLNPNIDENELKNKNIILVDEKSNSNGNVIYLIIRDNKAVSIFYGKSYVPQTPEKMKVDYIIKNIDNYNIR